MASTQLTEREDEVLRLAIGGRSNDEIAACLAISRRTVEAHMRTLFRKTGVTRRSQLAALYQGSEMVVAEQPGPVQPGGLNGLVPPVSQHRRDLASCERQLQAYAAAVRGLVDRQFALFEERVEITTVVGERDGQDIVIERRWTRPRPYVVYRVLGPIVTWPDDSPLDTDDLGLACTVAGQDTQADIHPVRDVNGRPLAMILFQPGLRDDTEWVLRYHSPKLWNPLRGLGQDALTWATATLDQRHRAKISDLTLKVIFPSSWTGERLTEHSNLGVVHTERLPTGRTQLIWRHESPSAGEYSWLLQGSPA